MKLRRPSRATSVRLGAAAASGILAAQSRPPRDLGWLALVALVPLFVAWRDRGPRASAGYAFVAGAFYYAMVCSWVWYFGAIAIVPFVAACAGYWAAAGAFIGWLRTRGIANPFLTAATWIVADAVIARWPFGGLSWGELGYAMHDYAPGRDVAAVGGVALVTLLVVALNAFIADLVANPPTLMRAARAYIGIALIAAVVVVSTVARMQPHVTHVLHVALVQGNDKDRELTDAEIDARYLPTSHFELARSIRDPVDLIVFPESSMDADPRTDPFVHSSLVAFAQHHHAWVLANATVDAPPNGKEADNLDVLFGPGGAVEGTYSKRHLVPFGERVPFRSFLQSWIGELNKVPRDFKPGDKPGLFDVADTRIATVICFESVFGYQIRPLVRDGAQVIVVSTNNRSYRRSANSAQHLAMGQMRAAETGRPVVQAAISGITAVIDADGVVHQRTGLFDRSVVETTVAATTGQTLYVEWGEWVTLGSIAVLVVIGGLALFRRRRVSSVNSNPQEVVSVASRIEGYGTSEPQHDDAEAQSG